MDIRKGVAAIVYRTKDEDTEFLILHRKLIWTGWEFPKGAIEKTIDKSLEELAVKRELEEETDIKKIRIVTKLPYVIKYKTPKKDQKYYKFSETVQSVFLIHALEDDVKTSIEHDRYMWLPYKAARKMLTHKNQKKALDMAWKFLKEKE